MLNSGEICLAAFGMALIWAAWLVWYFSNKLKQE